MTLDYLLFYEYDELIIEFIRFIDQIWYNL